MIKPTKAQLLVRDTEALNLLVLAPAGCGKTESLALRVAGLISRGQVPEGRRVLVATFSNRARDNIRSRLASVLPPSTMRRFVSVSNFHGLSARIYRAHANVIGMEGDWELPESDWIGDQCRSRGLSYALAKSTADALRISKQKPFTDAAVAAELATKQAGTALELEELRVAERRLTYDDLPRLAELILQVDSVAELYREHFASVVVDEFQDLTPQQLGIVQRIAASKTTYAGDLAQGIYSFAGAAPTEVYARIESECTTVIPFTESHRSSPVVLRMVNALNPLTGGQELTCADESRWPGDGLAGAISFSDARDEADWARRFVKFVLARAPGHRVGIISRTAARRRFVDEALAASGLPFSRWDDPLLDTDAARIMSAVMATLDETALRRANDPISHLREVVGITSIDDPSTRQSLADATAWACDLLLDGASASDVKARLKVGSESTLLSTSGAHLLTGHVGKGQQFDWVLVTGVEEGCIPNFNAKSTEELTEEARVLSVMISRARHGVVVCHATSVEDSYGRPWVRAASSFLPRFDGVPGLVEGDSVVRWLETAPWSQLSQT